MSCFNSKSPFIRLLFIAAVTSSLARQLPAQTIAWMKGSNATGQSAVYGTQGTPAAGNTPGARYAPASWTDTSGSLWLFGGYGKTDIAQGQLNDLWKYDV